MSVKVILLVIALICEVAAALHVNLPQVDLTALGIAFLIGLMLV